MIVACVRYEEIWWKGEKKTEVSEMSVYTSA